MESYAWNKLARNVFEIAAIFPHFAQRQGAGLVWGHGLSRNRAKLRLVLTSDAVTKVSGEGAGTLLSLL